MNADQREQREGESRENRDVAARNRDDVVRPRTLESFGHVIRQAGPVADQHGGNDRRRRLVVRRDPPADDVADARAHTGGPLLKWRALRDDVDEQAALDGCEQRRAAECQLTLEVRNTIVEISRRAPEGGARLDHSPGAPLIRSCRGRLATDGQRNTACHTVSTPVDVDGCHVHAERDVVLAEGRVLEQLRANGDRLVVVLGTKALDLKAADPSIENVAQ